MLRLGSRPSASLPADLPEAPTRPAAVQLRARRSNRLVVLGVLCACLGALIMAWVWTSTQQSQTVVVMAADVARGEQIEASDLGSTTLGRADGVMVIPAEQASELVGKHALVDLPAGSLPGPQSAGQHVVQPGMAHVGLRLTAGRLPTQPMPAGTKVWLVAVPSAVNGETEPGSQYAAIIVSAVQQSSDGAAWLVDVEVDESSAGEVAALAAVDQIALVRRGEA